MKRSAIRSSSSIIMAYISSSAHSNHILVLLFFTLITATLSSHQVIQYQEAELIGTPSLNWEHNYSFIPLAGEEHRIEKREDRDADTDMSSLKKANPTKKPTLLTKPDQAKPKATQVIVKSSGTGAPANGTPNHEPLNLTSSSSATITEEPFLNPENLTIPPNASEDNHTYYNSKVYAEPNEAIRFWVNLTALPDEHVITHEMLSSSHRRAATVNLKFDFPFYGNPMKNVTIATGGFLYLGDTVHSWLAATQYIAPLMANFDTSISNSSNIQYADNGTAFIVQWNDVMLQDNNPEGNFSFQVTLLNNGDIIFVYKDVPFPITDIPDAKHPVKVGFSDAYVIDRTIFFIRRKTIYEYHRTDLKKENITNNTAIYFKALPTCISLTSCEACTQAKIKFECAWCEAVNRCSDGFDRHRQDWLHRQCDDPKKVAKCDNTSYYNLNDTSNIPFSFPGERKRYQEETIPGERKRNQQETVAAYYNSEEHSKEVDGNAGFVSLFVILAFISGIAFWVFYAYKNPQSSSGQFLIRYRPAQWKWGSTEARYTAASIHM